MSAEKKKTPIIAFAAAILLLIAGGVTYFTQKPSSETTMVETVEADNPAQDTKEEMAQSEAAEVESAAGNAAEPIKTDTIESMDGINVEEGNPVVANVDGKDITRVDVYRFIQTMPANLQQMPALQIYPMAMEQVINTRIVQTQAEKSKIEETEEFKREMTMAKQQIARNLYLQKQVDAKITDKMVKNAYNDYVKKIPDVEERHARHILVETEDKAKAVIEKLNKGGEFAELAKELSVGPTNVKGGDLGFFAKEEMVPEFANAAFGMKKGETLKAPVKTQFGYHVIKLEDIRQRPKPSLEQMTPALRADLSRTILDDLIKDWRKNAEIEQFDINGKPLKKGANAIGIVPEESSSKNDG